MGLPPSEVRAMSLWQFHAVMDGWSKANKSEDDKSLSSSEEDRLWAVIQEDQSGG